MLRVQGSGFRVQGLRYICSGFRVQGSRKEDRAEGGIRNRRGGLLNQKGCLFRKFPEPYLWNQTPEVSRPPEALSRVEPFRWDWAKSRLPRTEIPSCRWTLLGPFVPVLLEKGPSTRRYLGTRQPRFGRVLPEWLYLFRLFCMNLSPLER